MKNNIYDAAYHLTESEIAPLRRLNNLNVSLMAWVITDDGRSERILEIGKVEISELPPISRFQIRVGDKIFGLNGAAAAMHMTTHSTFEKLPARFVPDVTCYNALKSGNEGWYDSDCEALLRLEREFCLK